MSCASADGSNRAAHLRDRRQARFKSSVSDRHCRAVRASCDLDRRSQPNGLKTGPSARIRHCSEPLVRMCAADILEDEGFEVIEAATAPAALEILEKRMM